jgi:hypothetical protein
LQWETKECVQLTDFSPPAEGTDKPDPTALAFKQPPSSLATALCRVSTGAGIFSQQRFASGRWGRSLEQGISIGEQMTNTMNTHDKLGIRASFICYYIDILLISV